MKTLLTLLALPLVLSAEATEPVDISTGELHALWQNGKLSLRRAGDDTPFLVDAVLGEANESSRVRIEPVRHPDWGDGKALILSEPSGGESRVALYARLPFALLQRKLTNRKKEEISIEKTFLIRGGVDLGIPDDQLRSYSTAGLLPATTPAGGYVYMGLGDPASRHGVLAGWLTHDKGGGVAFADFENGQAFLRARIDYGDLRIAAGASVTTEQLLVGVEGNACRGLERYAETIATHYAITLPAQPVFYMTWYSGHGGASDENRIRDNAAFIQKHLAPYGLTVLQIDDHWQKGIHLNGPRRDFSAAADGPGAPYPSGMKATADMMREKNLIPGIWYIPFAGTWHDPAWADRQDLFLKQGPCTQNHFLKTLAKAGIEDPYPCPEDRPFVAFWGGTSLDLTHPGALAYVREAARRLSRGWGYKFFKMDGLWTGTGTRIHYPNSAYRDDELGKPIRKNPAVAPMAAYRSGLREVRAGAGTDVFLLGCSQTQNMRAFGGSIGLVDAMRVGPDNGGGRSFRGVLQAVTFANRSYFPHTRLWYVDPDSFSVRDSVELVMTRCYLSWITLCGMLNSTSEYYPDLPPDRLDMLRRTMPSHHLKTLNPVDFLENEPAKVWTLTDEQAGPKRTLVGLFSWSEETAVHFDLPLARLGLDEQASYVGFDYWGDRFVPPFRERLTDTVEQQDCRILSLKPVSEHPQVVGTSRHITQGSVDLLRETWDGATGALSGRSRLVVGDRYEIRIVVPWREDSYRIVGVDVPEGISATHSQDGPCVRVALQRPAGGEIEWSIRFRKEKLPAEAPPKIEDFSAKVNRASVDLQWNRKGAQRLLLVREGGGTTVTRKLGRVDGFRDTSVKRGASYTYILSTCNWRGDKSENVRIEANLPARAVIPPFPPLPDVKLSDLPCLQSSSGWGSMQKNRSVAGGPLSLEGVQYKEGLGTHAPALMVYAIPSSADRFVAIVGLNDSIRKRKEGGSVLFRVYGDVDEMGEKPVLLAESPLLCKEEIFTWAFDIRLDPRFRKLHLEVAEGDRGNTCDHADWCNAGFRLRK